MSVSLCASNKKKGIYADLHIHTNYSDGIHSIEEVVKFVKEKKIKVIAITDHDTVLSSYACR